MFGRSWAIAFIVWWDLWQCSTQSPGLSATNSKSLVAPTGTLTVFSENRALGGMGPASVPVTWKRCPWMWIG